MSMKKIITIGAVSAVTALSATTLIELNHSVNIVKTVHADSLKNTKYAKSVSAYRNGTTYSGKAKSLDFSKAKYKIQTIKVNGKSIKVRAYTNVVYVSKPVSTKYQSMNIYIPDAYFHGKTINGYTKKTAPIFMPNSIGGYMSATPGSLTGSSMAKMNSKSMKKMKNNSGFKPTGNTGKGLNQNGGSSSGNAIQEALAKGMIVASPGARGRDAKQNGKNIGSAPAGIVDLKAAVRYLKLNDSKMPGNANKIISDGTSAGGALSALLASTGNNKDYYPYLKAIGAADTSDNIYAAYSFAPITNLDNADTAYEWEFNGVNTVSGGGMPGSSNTNTTLTDKQKSMSNELKRNFVTYVNSLGLTDNGQKLTLNSDGTGSFADYIKKQVINSANTAIAAGTKISAKDYPWLTIKDGKATDVNLSQYFAAVGRSKAPTAFDAVDLSSAEAQLFGTPTKSAQHFTSFGVANNTKSGASEADAQVVKMMNPMNYIGKSGSETAKHFWIRYGETDSNTSLVIPSIMVQKLKNAGVDVNYHLQWNTGHAGDYDMTNMFKWAAKITK